jgi:hypothetical protein
LFYSFLVNLSATPGNFTAVPVRLAAILAKSKVITGSFTAVAVRSCRISATMVGYSKLIEME